MTTPKDGHDESPKRRKRAEEIVRRKAAQSSLNPKALSREETRRTLHELRVHQIELELQNEELRQGRVALEASQARYFDLYDRAPVGYCTLNEKGLILEANLTAANLLGIERSRLLNRRLALYVMESERLALSAFIERVFAGRTPLACDLTLLAKGDGRIRARIEATLSQHRRECRVVMVDITERKQAEEALRQSEARLRLSVRSANIGLWDWDLRTNEVYFSPEWKNQLGYAEDEITNRFEEWQSRVHPEDLERALRQVHAYLAHPEGPHEMEVRLRHQDGSYRWIYSNADLLLDGAGKPVRMLGCHLDITERKRVEDQIRMFSQEIIAAREEERRRLAAVLHHDTGSLAVGLSAHLDAIEEELRSGKLSEGLRWTKRMRKLVEESVARLKDVAVQLRPPELDLLGLRPALRQYFSQITKNRRTRIQFTEDLGRRRVPGDTATILFRVAQEALTNAIKHGHAERVDVDLSASRTQITLTVRDHGQGYDPFEPPKRTTSHMGLRVMREMVAGGGGAFTVDSVPGAGTTVRARLPLELTRAPASEASSRGPASAPRRTPRAAGRLSRSPKGGAA